MEFVAEVAGLVLPWLAVQFERVPWPCGEEGHHRIAEKVDYTHYNFIKNSGNANNRLVQYSNG